MRLFNKSILTAGLLAAASAAPAFGQTTLFFEGFESPVVPAGESLQLAAAIDGINQFGDPSPDPGQPELRPRRNPGPCRSSVPSAGGGTGFNTDMISVAPGDIIDAEISVLTPFSDAAPAGSDGTTILVLDFFDASGAFAGTAAAGNQAANFNSFSAPADVDFNSGFDLFETLTVLTDEGFAPVAPDNAASAQITLVRLNNGNAGGSQYFDNLTVTAVPEPASLALLGAGGLALLGRRRRNG